MLTREKKLRAEKEEICAKQKVDLDELRKELDTQRTNIALLQAQPLVIGCKRSEVQPQVRMRSFRQQSRLTTILWCPFLLSNRLTVLNET
jgi:hypothetical protein